MPTDDFEPFRELPLTREQDAETHTFIVRRLVRAEPWDTLEFSYVLKDMLNPPEPKDGYT